MPISKHRKNRKPYNKEKRLQLTSIKASGIELQKLLDNGFKISKGQGLLDKNGAPTRYWIEKDIFTGKPRRLSQVLLKLKLLGVNGSYKNRKDVKLSNKELEEKAYGN